MNSIKRESKVHPEETSNIISRAFFWWTFDLIKKGYKETFSIKDLYNPLKSDRGHILGDQLEKNWKVQLSRSKPRLWRAIFFTFWKEYFKTVALALVHIIVLVSMPLVLSLFLSSFSRGSTSTFAEAAGCALAFMVLDFLRYFFQNKMHFIAFHLGGKIHVAICSLIYRKAIGSSKAALNEISTGNIVNLITHEMNRFHYLIVDNVNVLSTPLCILITSVILYTLSGFAGLTALLLVLTMSTIQVLTGSISTKYKRKTTEKAGERIQLIDEIVSGIGVIKMYTWEKFFASQVNKARRAELQLMRKAACFRNIFWTMNLFIPRIAMYTTLIMMLELGGRPTVETIYVIVPFLFILNDNLLLTYKGLDEMNDFSVSLQRIQSYLLLDDVPHSSYLEQNITFEYANKGFKSFKGDATKETSVNGNTHHQFHIAMNNLSTSWNIKRPKNVLNSVNLKFGKGKLYIVIGSVGSGKTSLLSSILKETKVTEGNMQAEGRLSYAAQDPWIFGGPIRKNILFGEPYDRLRYDQVLKVCSLVQDMEQFVNGDQSLVGEKGITLSGGQKARINLARAIYRQADVYLLDDPLSAVDARVSNRLFQECILKFLRNKTRILVTHQLQYIKDVDGIVLVDRGTAFFYQNFNEFFKEHSKYRNWTTMKETEVPANTVDIRSMSTIQQSPMILNQSMSEDDGSKRHGDTTEKSLKTKIPGGLLVKYFRAGSNWCLILIMCSLFFITQTFVCISDFFILIFATTEEDRYRFNHTMKMVSEPPEINKNPHPTRFNIYLIGTLPLIILVVGVIRTIVFDVLCLRGSEKLHDSALKAMMNTKIGFFHTNTSGRIVHRFSKDIVIVDENLPTTLIDAIQILSMATGAIVIICAVCPIFIIPSILIIGMSYWLRELCTKSSAGLSSLDEITRSLSLTHLNETLNGITTIRAFQAANHMIQEFDRYLDLYTSVWYNVLAFKFAFSFAFKMLMNAFVIMIISCFLFLKDDFQGGEVGLTTTQVFCLSGFISYGLFISADVANHLRSVERLVEYSELPAESNEKPRNKLQKPLPLNDWPSKGRIEFVNVTLRYSDDQDPVLKFLNFRIEPQQKIGIVGRTGAGKSSLISSLLRLSEINGLIKIDDIDTETIPLTTLRRCISIIPQDPILYSGTLRQNLDPFNECLDSDLWSALEQVELKKKMALESGGLDSRVLIKGANYSIGQRQLLCLARAMLRKNRILLLDEATANVDPYTDVLIQKTIRTKFKCCTVLTVAHRLNTIIDSDKVIVMDNGYLVEFDHPYKLLQNESGYFTKLVKEAGNATFQNFCRFAHMSYKQR